MWRKIPAPHTTTSVPYYVCLYSGVTLFGETNKQARVDSVSILGGKIREPEKMLYFEKNRMKKK